VASIVHHVQKREKGTKNERERERVCVLQKLDILFGLDTRSHSIHTIPPLAASTLITNFFFPKMMQFSKTTQRKKKKNKKLEGKQKPIFWNILDIYIYI
jgi:hypothetical protein